MNQYKYVNWEVPRPQEQPLNEQPFYEGVRKYPYDVPTGERCALQEAMRQHPEVQVWCLYCSCPRCSPRC